jgi:hypothetical protein
VGSALGGSAVTLDEPDEPHEHATGRERMEQSEALFTTIETPNADRAHRWFEEHPRGGAGEGRSMVLKARPLGYRLTASSKTYSGTGCASGFPPSGWVN